MTKLRAGGSLVFMWQLLRVVGSGKALSVRRPDMESFISASAVGFQEIPRLEGLSWLKDVRRAEDLRGRSDLPEPLFRGGSDGIPNWMDRLHGLGNAVVPQIAKYLAERIKAVMEA